jgi:COMPASS component SDC1
MSQLDSQDQNPSATISAAAHAYEVAMEQQTATPPSAVPDSTKDILMADSTPDRPEVIVPLLNSQLDKLIC